MNFPISIERFGKNDPRYWVSIGKPRPTEDGYHQFPIRLRVEFAPCRPKAGLTYSRDEDHTLMAALGWTVYVSWDRRGYDWPGREWGVSLWGEHLRVEWGCDSSEVRYFTDAKGKRRSKPLRGWQWSCFLLDVLFGQRKYTREEIARETRHLVMPEGVYKAECVVTHSTWVRPRWPWKPVSLALTRAEIDFDPPVGIPGKGENSYDCDDDATYSLTTTLKDDDLRATLDEFALDTLRTRQRRGGLNWVPAEGWPVNGEAA